MRTKINNIFYHSFSNNHLKINNKNDIELVLPIDQAPFSTVISWLTTFLFKKRDNPTVVKLANTTLTALNQTIEDNDIFGRFISSTYGWKFVFIGIALLVLLVILIVLNTIPKMNGGITIPLTRQIALFKKPKNALALSITFFIMTGYGIIFTYLSPYLVKTVGMSDHLLSITLLVLGVASLFGSKIGGLSADKRGVIFTLKRGLLVNITSLVALSFVSHSIIVVFIILIVWSFSGWSLGATQQFNLATISPESSDVMLGLNQSMMQLGFAVGAGLGGVIVGRCNFCCNT